MWLNHFFINKIKNHNGKNFLSYFRKFKKTRNLSLQECYNVEINAKMNYRCSIPPTYRALMQGILTKGYSQAGQHRQIRVWVPLQMDNVSL